MKIELTDSATPPNVIQLDVLKDKTTVIKMSPVKFRAGMIQRYGRDGAQATGDKAASARTIEIEFMQTSGGAAPVTADPAYYALLNQITGIFSLPENGPFYIVDTDNSRRAEVDLVSYGDQPVTGNLWRAGMNKLSFNWLSARWESNTEQVTSTETGGIANGETFVVNNPGELRAFAIIELTPVAATISEWTLRNQKNGSATRIAAANFTFGTIMTVDGVDGAINLDTGSSVIESSAALVDRFGFIVLDPGDNTFLYESAFGDCDITIKIREQFYF